MNAMAMSAGLRFVAEHAAIASRMNAFVDLVWTDPNSVAASASTWCAPLCQDLASVVDGTAITQGSTCPGTCIRRRVLVVRTRC